MPEVFYVWPFPVFQKVTPNVQKCTFYASAVRSWPLSVPQFETLLRFRSIFDPFWTGFVGFYHSEDLPMKRPLSFRKSAKNEELFIKSVNSPLYMARFWDSWRNGLKHEISRKDLALVWHKSEKTDKMRKWSILAEKCISVISCSYSRKWPSEQ